MQKFLPCDCSKQSIMGVPFEALDVCALCCDLFTTLPLIEHSLHLWSCSNTVNFPHYDLEKRRITFPRAVFNRFQPQTSTNKVLCCGKFGLQRIFIHFPCIIPVFPPFHRVPPRSGSGPSCHSLKQNSLHQ